MGGWSGVYREAWQDHALVRARLDAGADPDAEDVGGFGTPLHMAAEFGSPEVITELAARAGDIEADFAGRTPLWVAVYANRPENARALVAAGADPWRPMMSGWSPGRLSLAGPAPDLFARPAGQPGLTAEEAVFVAQAPRLNAVLGDVYIDGLGLACVAGIDAAEAVRRLGAAVEQSEIEHGSVVGVTTVPGGCVITQPWGYAPQMMDVMERLTPGTVCYGLYANPKSGNQGSIARNGSMVSWDLHPGGEPYEDSCAHEVLISYLYQGNAIAFACGFVGAELTGAHPVTGPPDLWARLPDRDHRN